MSLILVIEDEADIRFGILKALEYEGYDTLEAADGERGIALAQQHRPELIICDILMPERSGYSVLIELRQDPRTAMIPFIFLTAMTARKDVEDGIQLGADAYVTKPFAIAQLLSLISAMLVQQDSSLARHLKRLRVGLAQTLPLEIQAPLTGILGFSGLLAHSDAAALPRPEDLQDIQMAMYAHARRLQRVMGNYLLYYELQLLQHEPDMLAVWRLPGQEIDRDTLTRAVRAKAHEFERAEDVILNAPDAAMPFAPGILRKLLEELLDNAFQFSKPGTPVEVNIRQTTAEASIGIHDCGCGMTPEQLADPEQTYGLGLHICRLLARVYNGDVSIRSQPGEGTTIAVTLQA